MKIKTKVFKEVDIEVKLPYFCKSKNERVFYKVLNEKGHNIEVKIYGFATSIEFSTTLNENLVFVEYIKIEEGEFNLASAKVMATLIAKVSE